MCRVELCDSLPWSSLSLSFSTLYIMQTDESYTAIEPRVTEPRPYMEHELLAEIFQMLPESVLADMYDLANALFYNVMQGTADRLATECPEKRREIKAALDTYQVTAEKKLDEVFNVFQQYVSQSTWKIPDDLDVQFDHHKVVENDMPFDPDTHTRYSCHGLGH